MATEAPEIDLDASLRKGLAVRAGCPIRLFAVIRGRPAPKVTWKRLGVDNVIRRGHVDQVDTMSFLVIPESTREDSGKYSLTLSNSAGEKAVFVRVKVLGEKQTNNEIKTPSSNDTVRMISKSTLCRYSWSCWRLGGNRHHQDNSSAVLVATRE